MLERIKKQIGDPRILELISKFLSAGYIDANSGKLVTGDIGAPQGGILSPILSNIVMHEFDKFMKKSIENFNRGKKRRMNPTYKSIMAKRGRATNLEIRKALLMQMRKMRSVDMFDKEFRRMEYVRYADDFVVLITGSLKDANFIRNNIKDFLKTHCGLELNLEKSIISNIRTDRWKFLGAQIQMVKWNPS